MSVNPVYKVLLIPLLFIFLGVQISCTNQNSESQNSDSSSTDLKSGNHFDKKGLDPSSFTVAKWEELKSTLPFEDKRDFEETKKGFMAEPSYRKITHLKL